MHKSSKSISTNMLIGQAIKSWDGKNLGRIEELIIDPVSHQIISAVVSPGSGDAATVPWDALALSETDDPDSQPTRVVVYSTRICRPGI